MNPALRFVLAVAFIWVCGICTTSLVSMLRRSSDDKLPSEIIYLIIVVIGFIGGVALMAEAMGF